MQLHSWRVVILSKEYSQRHSLQVSRGSRANSPASDSSAVMVWGQAFPAEPIRSLIVHSAWKEKSTAETSHKPCSHFSLTWEFTAQIHKSTCSPKCTSLASWCQSYTSGHSKFTKKVPESPPPQKAWTGLGSQRIFTLLAQSTSVRPLIIKLKKNNKKIPPQTNTHTDETLPMLYVPV